MSRIFAATATTEPSLNSTSPAHDAAVFAAARAVADAIPATEVTHTSHAACASGAVG